MKTLMHENSSVNPEDKKMVKISVYTIAGFKKTLVDGAKASRRSLNNYCHHLLFLGYEAETAQLKKLNVK